MSLRNERIRKTLMKEISDIIQKELKDSRIHGIVSITDIEVAHDNSFAKVYYSVFAPEEEKKVTIEKKSEENVESEKNSVSVENVINMAKKNPLNKEKINEKISNGNDYVADNSDVCKRVESARSNSDGTGK